MAGSITSGKRRGERALARSPLQHASMRWPRGRLRVLAYHGVPDERTFATQLDWLVANTQPVSLDEVRNATLAGRVLPAGALLVTFDDGERSVLEVAAPLLRQRDVPAVAFVIAGLVDTDEPFWWREVEELAGPDVSGATSQLVRRLKTLPDVERRQRIHHMRQSATIRVTTPQLTGSELRELELAGIEVGSHSLTHPCLDMCDDETIQHEVGEAHLRLTEILGHAPLSFAYPNGNWDYRVVRAVRGAGHSLAFTFDHRLASTRNDPLLLSRIRVDAGSDLDRFAIRVSGLHPTVHRLRGGR